MVGWGEAVRAAAMVEVAREVVRAAGATVAGKEVEEMAVGKGEVAMAEARVEAEMVEAMAVAATGVEIGRASCRERVYSGV